jgi:hypothetical protein
MEGATTWKASLGSPPWLRGIAEGADDLDELGDGAWPAVSDDQRQCIGLGRADVQEVDVLPVDGGGELGEPVEPGFLGAPVVGAAPVLGQLSQVLEGDAAAPAGTG